MRKVYDTDQSTYKAALDHAPFIVARFGTDLSLLYYSRFISEFVPGFAGGVGPFTYREGGIPPHADEFYRRNVATVLQSGQPARETRVLKVPQGYVAGEFIFWPEFAANGEIISVFCLMSDLTQKDAAQQAMLLNERRFIALDHISRMEDETEEEIASFALKFITLFTESPYAYLFLADPGEGVARIGGKGRLYWSEAMRALSDKLPVDHLPLEGLSPWHDSNGEISATVVVEPDFLKSQRNVFGVLQINRYVIVPVLENGRAVCVASVCNKDSKYTENDLRQFELFIRGVWMRLRQRTYIGDLKAAKERAESGNRAKNEFLANVSHELRTPLNGMLSMLQLLTLTDLNAEQAGYVTAAGSSGKALVRIISDILDLTRMESGNMLLQPGIFNVAAALRSTMSLFAAEARDKEISITLDIAEDIPDTLIGDDARLRQIVFNLAGNALKFTEQGGIRLECSVLHAASHGKTVWIYLSVADTGIGMPEEAHGSIFEAFTQLDGSSTRKYSGTGLGLTIVKRLIRAMGGALTVESEPGRGTVMHCSLPFTLPDESAATRKAIPETAMKPDHKKGKKDQSGQSDQGAGHAAPQRLTPHTLDILVAEDDPVSQFATRAFLARTGHRVVCVGSGRAALEALMLHPFDCLITDIQMPVMDGIELTRRIRAGDHAGTIPSAETLLATVRAIPEALPEEGPLRDCAIPVDLPIVALTAHAMSGNRERFLNAGMDFYLSKPLVLKELSAYLENIHNKKSK